MSRRAIKLHPESYEWMTDEIRELLRGLTGRHAVKKRTSVIRLASAKAQQRSLKPLFKDPAICSETIWYSKWCHDPLIAAAFDACYNRSLNWIDEETAAVEEHYRQLRRQRLASYSSQAPAALAHVMADQGQKGSDRISAASALIKFADPEVAGRVRTPGGFDVNVELPDLDKAIERELLRLGAVDADVDATDAVETEAQEPAPAGENGQVSAD